MEGNKPEKKFSTGVISATVWKNNGVSKKTGQPTEYRTVTIDRRYTDKDGKWQSTNSMRVNDLPKASLVLQKAYEHIVLKDANGAAVSSDEQIAVEEVV